MGGGSSAPNKLSLGTSLADTPQSGAASSPDSAPWRKWSDLCLTVLARTGVVSQSCVPDTLALSSYKVGAGPGSDEGISWRDADQQEE